MSVETVFNFYMYIYLLGRILLREFQHFFYYPQPLTCLDELELMLINNWRWYVIVYKDTCKCYVPIWILTCISNILAKCHMKIIII